MSNATAEQISTALTLLDDAGYDTAFVNPAYILLGATPTDRQGTVRDWLHGMSVDEISRLIKGLLREVNREAAPAPWRPPLNLGGAAEVSADEVETYVAADQLDGAGVTAAGG